VNPAGIITTYAGTGQPAYGGDGGPAAAAQIFGPWQLALDRSGNLYVADYGNSRVRKIDSSGIITTVAGGGTGLGDGGPATAAGVGGNLLGVAVDAAGNLYITSDARIRTPPPA
jgi:DNA-binding beta-propeller fold protein YncE